VILLVRPLRLGAMLGLLWLVASCKTLTWPAARRPTDEARISLDHVKKFPAGVLAKAERLRLAMAGKHRNSPKRGFWAGFPSCLLLVSRKGPDVKRRGDSLCCSGSAPIVTCSEGVSAALGPMTVLLSGLTQSVHLTTKRPAPS
jgi:hypothetical protein